jgi:hypothetical protein
MHTNNTFHKTRYIKPQNFSKFTYAKHSHWSILEQYAEELYGQTVEPTKVQLKVYQDLLVYAFIRENIGAGKKLLDVGGGNSRVLKRLSKEYECWNIDPFDGCGNGPTITQENTFRLVRDYMGNFNTELPDNYFDFVFSISALEHTPNDPLVHQRILDDINRVLAPGAYSLHLLDIIFRKENHWVKDMLLYMFDHTAPLNGAMKPLDEMLMDPDLYLMTKEPYDTIWKSRCNNLEYEEFGYPCSVNVLWQKPYQK